MFILTGYLALTRRIAEITQVPPENYEAFQLLRYNVGEEYKVHHDMNPEENNFLSGPRILTVGRITLMAGLNDLSML